MLEVFRTYIKENGLAGKKDRLLLAVSGGIDSMVMTHLFSDLHEFEFAIVHCNFQLRGNESIEDQVFVGELAGKLSCRFFTVGFETSDYAKSNNISIQMAARQLRYQWFKKIAEENNYTRVAVAHNRDDIAETVLLNLVRGTGIKGLTGIPPKSGIVIRPLLFAGRHEIENYAWEKSVAFREDKSNSELKYKRNILRHEVIPVLQKINPSFFTTIIEETEIFQSGYAVYSGELKRLKEAIIRQDGTRTYISIHKLRALKIDAPLLFDLLGEYGFGYSVVKDILRSLDMDPGRYFHSKTHVLLKDRTELILESNTGADTSGIVFIDEDNFDLTAPIRLKSALIKRTDSFSIPTGGNSIAVDRDSITFPLTLRRWEKGDAFTPLGMKGRKKLSDFFIDRKINRIEKQNIWVLTSNNQIIWVIGYQIDDRVRITEATTSILLLQRKA
jgi:tRNA(Ile)-lysidine synthase